MFLVCNLNNLLVNGRSSAPSDCWLLEERLRLRFPSTGVVGEEGCVNGGTLSNFLASVDEDVPISVFLIHSSIDDVEYDVEVS